ncbi:EamA family transporter RarD [Aestuariibacter sp. GS-14]|uniref:EamA family transporter RarD n=1 Tax=Aestuariibacter sp. GS-14 TaxID=2590670 RepID=UPI001127AFB0|nr:EamA family transporter RarD [Aestuariibacter sp. GS-14]TPV54366.1 EamA family transporter RarD [Aestuariibacter sp. GS-14]
MLYAIAAYTMWGVAPLYFKQLVEVPPTDILMHRVIWSALLLCVLLLALGQMGKMRAVFASKRLMYSLSGASVLLGANWLLFIWAINSNYMLEASLGYYINPIINVFLGRLILQERLRPLQKFAVLLAIAGVANIIIAHGTLPWIALTLACTFSVYGLIRKQIPVEPMPGLFMETLVLLPFALLYWVMFASEQSNMLTNDWALNGWLLAAGVVTTMPLLAFNAAAKRILFTTLGLFQYIGPTLMFIIAVWLYQESLEPARLITFALVWTGLLLFSVDAWRGFKKQRKVIASVVE